MNFWAENGVFGESWAFETLICGQKRCVELLAKFGSVSVIKKSEFDQARARQASWALFCVIVGEFSLFVN